MDFVSSFLDKLIPPKPLISPESKTVFGDPNQMKLTMVPLSQLASPATHSQPPAPAQPVANDFLQHQILARTRQYGIPDALAAGQYAVESSRGVNRPDNNYFGLGPNIKYPNLDANVRDYYLTLKNILSGKGYDLSKMKDPLQILNALQQGQTRYEGHSPDPLAYPKLVSNTPEYRQYSK